MNLKPFSSILDEKYFSKLLEKSHIENPESQKEVQSQGKATKEVQSQGKATKEVNQSKIKNGHGCKDKLLKALKDFGVISPEDI